MLVQHFSSNRIPEVISPTEMGMSLERDVRDLFRCSCFKATALIVAKLLWSSQSKAIKCPELWAWSFWAEPPAPFKTENPLNPIWTRINVVRIHNWNKRLSLEQPFATVTFFACFHACKPVNVCVQLFMTPYRSSASSRLWAAEQHFGVWTGLPFLGVKVAPATGNINKQSFVFCSNTINK